MTDYWRKQRTHRTETKAVKTALTKAGYRNVRVGHGSGTAWEWLDIHCSPKPDQSSEHKRAAVIRIAKQVTGRHGDYDGRINVHSASGGY